MGACKPQRLEEKPAANPQAPGADKQWGERGREEKSTCGFWGKRLSSLLLEESIVMTLICLFRLGIDYFKIPVFMLE